MVRIDAITSNDPPSTRLPGKDGSYSHIAVEFSIAAILVIWLITATFAMLTTCAQHLHRFRFSMPEGNRELTEVGSQMHSKDHEVGFHGALR
jgi:hypothetical protein